MTTITRAPLLFWSASGEVLARMPGQAPVVLDDAESWDVLEHLAIERRACTVSGDRATRARVMLSALHLTKARLQASLWRRASGDIPRAA